MNIGLKITATGFVLLCFSMITISYIGKPMPSLWVGVPLILAFAAGVVMVPAGMILSIWI